MDNSIQLNAPTPSLITGDHHTILNCNQKPPKSPVRDRVLRQNPSSPISIDSSSNQVRCLGILVGLHHRSLTLTLIGLTAIGLIEFDPIVGLGFMCSARLLYLYLFPYLDQQNVIARLVICECMGVGTRVRAPPPANRFSYFFKTC